MGWIQTYTGKEVDPFYLNKEDICIEDIAHSLALQCRFNGHCLIFYSLAEHCCRVSDICSTVWKAHGLLHDASEAYLSDIPSPVKQELPEYKAIEKKIEYLIEFRFGIVPQVRMDVVKECDQILLATEARDLMCYCETPWVFITQAPLSKRIVPWGWMRAEEEFLSRAEKFGLK